MIWNMQLVRDGQQIQFEAEATFLIIFGALIIIKVKILVLLKWSCKLGPPNYVDCQT